MVLTILEAEVSPKKWNELKAAFEKMTKNPPAMAPMHAYLVQSMEDVNIWQLMGVWRSREDVQNMQAHGTPRGIQLFRDLGSEPSMSMYDVVGSAVLPESMPMSQH